MRHLIADPADLDVGKENQMLKAAVDATLGGVSGQEADERRVKWLGLPRTPDGPDSWEASGSTQHSDEVACGRAAQTNGNCIMEARSEINRSPNTYYIMSDALVENERIYDPAAGSRMTGWSARCDDESPNPPEPMGVGVKSPAIIQGPPKRAMASPAACSMARFRVVTL